MTATAIRAHTGAAAAGVPFGTSPSILKMIGMTATGISMITVPATVGVKMRRNNDSRDASANWNREEMTTRVASMPGPPFAIAVMQTEMKAPEVPISRT